MGQSGAGWSRADFLVDNTTSIDLYGRWMALVRQRLPRAEVLYLHHENGDGA